MTVEEIRSLQIFWSLRRRRYWKQCRLKYFLHYYAASLGRREEADALCQEARELDRRISAQAVVRIILCRTMHKLFDQGRLCGITDEAVANFRETASLMVKYPDTAPFIVPEIFSGGGAAVDRIAQEILHAGEKLDKDFWQSIKNIPMAQRRPVMRPQRVNFLELCCYFVPVLAFSFHGEMWVLESSAVNEEGDLLSCLHRMWVFNELGLDPARVRSVYLDDSCQLKQLEDLPSVSAALAEIKKDLHEMVEADMEGHISIHDFPPCPGKICESCQFRPFCLRNGHISD